MNTDHDEVTILTTGGTIEKTYDEFDGSLENRGSHLKNRILAKLRLPYTRIKVICLMAKDSLHMTDEDRELIVATIEKHLKTNRPVVVLHGTDTMAVTAELAFNTIKNPTAPIVFTGAMRPMGFEDTDATQNVTEALLSSKLLKSGVYISFHNRIFDVPNVRKNKEKRTFESV